MPQDLRDRKPLETEECHSRCLAGDDKAFGLNRRVRNARHDLEAIFKMDSERTIGGAFAYLSYTGYFIWFPVNCMSSESLQRTNIEGSFSLRQTFVLVVTCPSARV